jgi:hypothetical protein
MKKINTWDLQVLFLNSDKNSCIVAFDTIVGSTGGINRFGRRVARLHEILVDSEHPNNPEWRYWFLNHHLPSTMARDMESHMFHLCLLEEDVDYKIINKSVLPYTFASLCYKNYDRLKDAYVNDGYYVYDYNEQNRDGELICIKKDIVDSKPLDTLEDAKMMESLSCACERGMFYAPKQKFRRLTIETEIEALIPEELAATGQSFYISYDHEKDRHIVINRDGEEIGESHCQQWKTHLYSELITKQESD